VNAVASHIAHAALWLLVLAVLLDVSFRSLGRPLVWASEISIYLMVALAFFGIGHTWTQGGHFRVTLLVSVLNPKARRAIEFLCATLALGFSVAYTIGAYKLAAFSFALKFTTPTVLRMPIWLLQGVIVAGGAFLTLAIFEDLLRVARGVRREDTALSLPPE
jgi:TRAP-type C4-dicarboxylate transport system permease small subunit